MLATDQMIGQTFHDTLNYVVRSQDVRNGIDKAIHPYYKTFLIDNEKIIK
ncbi:hypothetical protein MU1_09360 [Paenibacillus glycanilyticus]|uniref:Uncharacterized protein n=1 Tax=Paenibacillus glycanilyticus TaxID=126569 RepID=A0ABQ6GBZ7_9BACL|nr:hypothetical protein MU1_09360 [Paenibacillus glycanilyticus]